VTGRLDAVPGALVIGSDHLALGVVRSLGRRNIPVWVLTTRSNSTAATSRYARRRLAWPIGDDVQQCNYLLELAQAHRLRGWVLFATDDPTAKLLASNQALLSEWFKLTTAPWSRLRWAFDKRLTYQLAESLGLDHPRTYYPRSREEVASLACTFPVILKPAFKDKISNDFTSAKAWRVTDRRELLDGYDAACRLVEPDAVMVQEFIPGGGKTQFSYAAACVGGQARAWLVARRTRQYPTDFGRASSFVETVDQPLIEGPSEQLIAALDYDGPIEIEFKLDLRDGRYKLLDVNARVWGWHTIGRRAGVDFPYLLWCAAQGQPVPELRGRTGVRWIRLATDLAAAASEVSRGELSAGAYVRCFRGPLEFAIFAPDDLAPALAEASRLLGLLEKRIRGSTRGTSSGPAEALSA
jgi:D-aspartate ligase